MTTTEASMIQLLRDIRDGAVDRTEGLAQFEAWLRNRHDVFSFGGGL